jgi:tetratricopeptide (TPR) repeat protein
VVLCVREDLLRDRPIETSALSRIRNHPRTTGMKLNVLQTHECRALVAKLLPFTEEVIDYVTMRSDGLPAHAVQLVTDWIEQGHVERTDKGFTIPPRWRPDLPGTIHAALQDRIRRLFAHESANAEVALEIFVALGSDIDEVTLLEVARRAGVNTQGEFLTRLEEAGLAQFEEERWTLCWQSLTESVEQSARESGRWKQHHLQAAELFLERVDSGQDQFLSAAGRHFVAAEEWHRGIPILLQAAQHERFLRRPTRGLALLDSCDEAIQFAGSGAPQSARATSLGLRANLLKLVGKPSSEWAILAKEAEDLARKGSHMKALAEALRARSIWLRIGQRHEEGLAVIDEYLSICRTIEDPQGLIEASIQRTKMLKAGGNKKEALSSAQETVKIADELGNCTDQVNTRTALLAVHVSMGNLTEADRLLGQLSPLIGHSEVSVEVRFQILGWNGSVQFLLGNYERGREAFHSAIEQAQTSLSSMLWFRMLSDFAEAEKTAGFLERAERLFEQAEAVAAPFPNSAITRLMRVNRTILEMQRGEYARAAHRFQQIKFPSDREDDPAYGIVKGFIDFFLKQSEGSWEQAEEQLLEVRKKIDETGSLERDFAVLFEQAGRICIEAGRRELAQTALDEAIRFWEQTGGESEDLQRCLAMRPEDPRKT